MKPIIHDTLFVLGAAACTYGCWLGWPPLGWLVGGVALMGMGIFVAGRRT